MMGCQCCHLIFLLREGEDLSWEKAGSLPFPIASGPQVGVGACDVSSEDYHDISFEEEWVIMDTMNLFLLDILPSVCWQKSLHSEGEFQK